MEISAMKIESIHDRMHVWTGGSMQEVATAAFDPLFYTHHAMIDRVWWLWQLNYGNSGIPPELLNAVLVPFNLTVRDVLNIYDLGYDYAKLTGGSRDSGLEEHGKGNTKTKNLCIKTIVS